MLGLYKSTRFACLFDPILFAETEEETLWGMIIDPHNYILAVVVVVVDDIAVIVVVASSKLHRNTTQRRTVLVGIIPLDSVPQRDPGQSFQQPLLRCW